MTLLLTPPAAWRGWRTGRAWASAQGDPLWRKQPWAAKHDFRQPQGIRYLFVTSEIGQNMKVNKALPSGEKGSSRRVVQPAAECKFLVTWCSPAVCNRLFLSLVCSRGMLLGIHACLEVVSVRLMFLAETKGSLKEKKRL